MILFRTIPINKFAAYSSKTIPINKEKPYEKKIIERQPDQQWLPPPRNLSYVNQTNSFFNSFTLFSSKSRLKKR
jgi:hypothetical protein